MTNEKLFKILATGFYSGMSPIAPGTCGSIIAALIGYYLIVLFSLGFYAWIIICILVTGVSIYTCDRVLPLFSGKDPSAIVIDEFAGMFIALIPITMVPTQSIIYPIVCFALFRFFDITKIWPIKYFEQFEKGLGITLDDVAAGIIAAALGCFILAV